MKDASGSKNYELLKQCYAMVGGVPKSRFDLAYYRLGASPSTEIPEENLTQYQREAGLHRCGTLFCAAGFCTVYPPFVKLGLKGVGESQVPNFAGMYSFTALARFFGITLQEAEVVFGQDTRFLEGDHSFWSRQDLMKHEKKSDKKLWLLRCKAFLRSKGEIK